MDRRTITVLAVAAIAAACASYHPNPCEPGDTRARCQTLARDMGPPVWNW